MDADINELVELISERLKPGTESSLTVKWVVVIGLVVAIVSFLTLGYINNAINISKIQAKQEAWDKVQDTQGRCIAAMTTKLNEIREAQIVHEAKTEGKPSTK